MAWYERGVACRVGAWPTALPHPQELAAQQEEAELDRGPAPPGPPTDYKDKYRHLIGCEAAILGIAVFKRTKINNMDMYH